MKSFQEDVRLFIVWGEAELAFAGETEEKKKRAGRVVRKASLFLCDSDLPRLLFGGHWMSGNCQLGLAAVIAAATDGGLFV